MLNFIINLLIVSALLLSIIIYSTSKKTITIKQLISVFFKKWGNYTTYYSIKNIFSVIALIGIFYKIVSYMSWDLSVLGFIFSYLISFGVSNFILDKFTYSEIKFIKITQRFVFYYIIFVIIGIVFIYFNL